MSDSKKQALGRILNVSIDRKRKVLSTILFKAIGMSLNLQNGEDAFGVDDIKKFLKALDLEVFEDTIVEGEPREYLNLYMLLYTAIFGNYEEIKNTLAADKIKTKNEALINVYENQRSDEVPTLEGSISLMNAKFFDHRRYDLTKAGRYKLKKKLSVIDRIEENTLKEDVVSAEGKVIYKKGKKINKEEINVLQNIKAEKFMLSHRTPFEKPKGIIMRWLGDIYDRRVKGEVYIEI